MRVRLTRKGSTLRDRLSGMIGRQIDMLGQSQITEKDLESVVMTLQRMERFWMRPGISR
jgi:cobalamin biosynthesis protein CobD/CbiB